MPIVSLKMGPSLNPDDIKEGDGVYFECHIRSNPKPYKMAWFHDVSTLIYYFMCKHIIHTIIPIFILKIIIINFCLRKINRFFLNIFSCPSILLLSV